MASDPLSDLSMKPSRDELATRQQGSRRKGSHKVDLKKTADTPSGRNGPLLGIILLIMMGASGGGWFMWQEVEKLRAELSQSKELLSESQSRLGDLKENLASQSSTLNEAGSQIEKDLQLHMSEIRKLWDLSNKRNRPDIEANQKSIAALKKSVAQQKKQLANTEAIAAANKKTVAALQAQVQQGQVEASVISSQIEKLTAQLKELSAQNKALKNMISSQEIAITELQEISGAALEKKLTEVVQRLDAIDAHRRQVNARLDQHDRNISELYQKP